MIVFLQKTVSSVEIHLIARFTCILQCLNLEHCRQFGNILPVVSRCNDKMLEEELSLIIDW